MMSDTGSVTTGNASVRAVASMTNDRGRAERTSTVPIDKAHELQGNIAGRQAWPNCTMRVRYDSKDA